MSFFCVTLCIIDIDDAKKLPVAPYKLKIQLAL
ncbi:hypothetical protein D0399_10575 [Staphylococcus epidermidis]|nr:hypothetical protein [Staphylococcus epidermidis]MBM0798489.1 hypothetical protein [Staphylococcus epidermidis]MBM0800712.1 hypothetical protein [Staphylococcus epidermidis]MBM0838171.1 hypothetical protein [Staphylococcus epidermidis]MBM0872352.1 hypothetical protein [Staphylococcus epidermidis]